jgi:hypothetical protein
MTIPNEKEQEELLRWQEEQLRKRNGDGPTTSKIKQEAAALLREQGILVKLNAAADEAHKAWTVAQKWEANQKKIKDAILRASAAEHNTLKANLE